MKNCIVTVNYNDYETTQQFITRVMNFSCVDFVVIVDNASTDDSYNKLCNFINEKVKVIPSPQNGGYGFGNNLGFKYLKNILNKEFNLIISNPDIEIDEQNLQAVLACLQDDKVGIAAPVITENKLLNRGWKIPSVGKDTLINIPFLGKTFSRLFLQYNDKHYQTDLSDVESVSGSIFAIKSTVFESAGMFDENLFLYYEENILCLMVARNNQKIVVNNQATAKHQHSISIDKNQSKFKKLETLKTSQKYFHHNYSKTNKFNLLMLDFSVWLLLKLYLLRHGSDKNE